MFPSRTVSAAFLCGILLGTAGTVAGATIRGSSIFSDVQPGAYYDDAIGDLYNAGIIKGMTATEFGTTEYITRADVAVLMYRLRNELLGIEPGQSSSRSSRSSSTSTSTSSSSTSSSSSSSSSSISSRSPQGAFRFTTAAYTVPENEKTLTVTVVRVGGAKGQVTVAYAMTPGTATADTDYSPISGTLVFADGNTSKTLSIAITDDQTAESNETMTIALSNPTDGAQLDSGATATITIVDNETGGGTSSAGSSANAAGTFEFGAAGYTVAENGATATVSVVRSGGSTGTVGVTYTTGNSTATSGTHYTATTGTLSFAAGETSKTFTVPILDNTSIDGATKFNLTLSAPTGGASLGTPTSTVTILDNDASSFTFGTGSLKFTVSTLNAQEGSNAVVTVLRGGGTVGTISVKYSTFGSGGATSADYTSTSGTLTFQPGESSKLIRVPITNDSVSDPGEEFSIRLSEPSSSVLLMSPDTVVVTIDQ